MERMDSEDRAARATAEVDELFRTAPFLLVRIGFDGYLKRVNPAWSVLGWSEEELLGRPWATFLIHPDDLERTKGAVAAMMQGTQVVEFEMRLMCKDGSGRWFSASGRPRPEEQAFYGIGIDITERKRAEESVARLNVELALRAAQLEAANKELESFAYSVSHDLRAPLRVIDGFARILAEEQAIALSADGKEHLQMVRQYTRKMGALIDDLLAFSRLSRQAMRSERVEMGELAREALLELERERKGRDVEVVLRDLPACVGDRALLRQVWLNLLSNALKFTRPRDHASIEVGSRMDGERPEGLTYYVKDNGVGFDMKYTEKLFRVFQRLHGEEQFEGTGAGLAIVQRIVERHGGRVWAEAELDHGATFSFTLGGGGS